MSNLSPNRIAVYLTALAGLAGGLAPVVADLDLASTAGVVAGLATILGVVNRWLVGWQKHEEREAIAELPGLYGGDLPRAVPPSLADNV